MCILAFMVTEDIKKKTLRTEKDSIFKSIVNFKTFHLMKEFAGRIL